MERLNSNRNSYFWRGCPDRSNIPNSCNIYGSGDDLSSMYRTRLVDLSMQGIASPKEIEASKENNIFHIVDIVCMQGWDFFFRFLLFWIPILQSDIGGNIQSVSSTNLIPMLSSSSITNTGLRHWLHRTVSGGCSGPKMGSPNIIQKLLNWTGRKRCPKEKNVSQVGLLSRQRISTQSMNNLWNNEF